MASSIPIAIASAMNDVEIANLNGLDDIALLINDYFAGDENDSTSEVFDSDSEDDEGEDELPEAGVVDNNNNNPEPVLGDNDNQVNGEVEVDDEEAELLQNIATSYLFVNSDRQKEMRMISDFSCKCTAAQQGQCMKAINLDDIYSVRLSMQEMSHYERDLILIGKISASTVISELT